MKSQISLLILMAVLITVSFYNYGYTKSKRKKAAAIKKSLYHISIKDITGKRVSLSQYKGKALLIVNVASRCGFTKQYKGLQSLYEKYQDKGLVVIGVPSNDFGKQEPGTNDDIKTFCTTNFNVTFPMMSKVSVRGKNQHPLYSYLTDKTQHNFGGNISWNFTKFLVDQNGFIRSRRDEFGNPLIYYRGFIPYGAPEVEGEETSQIDILIEDINKLLNKNKK